MTKKVSVVIPVWNPGRYIDRCIASLVAQTMPAEDFEVLFMDDGSTDGTQDRLDELATAHPHFVVHHLPNSGWPGKPRNFGIDRAAGEYVFFMDNDDALGAEALERMYAIGARNTSDIVIGKVISNFRGVPHQVFRYTRERCTVHDAPLFDSLTPHKMFRRAFLLDNGIRYPEGKRRLEDQLIMARAYFPAKSVSIVGDYVCYYYLKRDDGKNAGSTRIEPAAYYDNLREVLDVVEANTEPGEFRNSIQRRFYRGEMLGRVGGSGLLQYQPHYREALLAEVRRLTLEPRFAPEVHAGLPVLLRARSHLVREGNVEDLLTAAQRSNAIHARARLKSVQWQNATLRLTVDAWFTFAGERLELNQRHDRLSVSPELAPGVPEAQLECTDQVADLLADVTIRNRDTADEFFLPADLRCRRDVLRREDGQAVVSPRWQGDVHIDPSTALGGRRLPRGVWDVNVRLSGLGVSRTIRLGSDRDAAVSGAARSAIVGDEAIVVIPYWTDPYGNLSLDIDQHAKSIKDALTLRPAQVRLTGRIRPSGLTAQLPLIAGRKEFSGAELRLIERRTAAVRDQPMTVEPTADGLTASSRFRSGDGQPFPLTPGTWDILLIIPELGSTIPTRCGLVVRVPRYGASRVLVAPESSVRRVGVSDVRAVLRSVRREGVGATIRRLQD